ncbi:MAG: PfkB family carbohydrate kinase, partial [Pseudomonadota bacterium]
VTLRKAGDTLFAFDSNYRTQLWPDEDTARATISAFWDIADIALPSIDDEMALRGQADEKPVIDWFSARSWTACAIKRGARGPLSPTLETGRHPDFPPAQTVVDTTSAGDAFNGAFLAAFSRGEPIANCLSAGHKLASIVVGHRGAII